MFTDCVQGPPSRHSLALRRHALCLVICTNSVQMHLLLYTGMLIRAFDCIVLPCIMSSHVKHPRAEPVVDPPSTVMHHV